uniref:RING-type E3 ubiquitin transferase n=1 Tax=Meloidogyne hapla TaxID=6305 RepID=A0A1I8B6A2_MELHA
MDEKQQQSPIIMDNCNNNNGGSTSSKIGSPLLDTGQSEDPSICPYCNKKFRKPRVLDCLHSMCEDCIIAQLDDGRNNQQKNSKNILKSFMELELEDSVVGRRPTPPGVICCSVCNQDPMFVSLMLLDFVKIREFGFNDANDNGRMCEACKSEEKALANCIHCCSDLCSKCVQAHQDMKMFDGHKVVMFSEKDKLANNQEGAIAKEGMEPIKLAICNKHKGDFELICPSCDELLCKQCAYEHIEHNCSPLNDLGRSTLEARSAIPDRKFLLQQSYHKCRDKIEDAFQFYARVINEVKLDLLASLEKNRDEKDEHLDSLYQKIDMQTSRLQDALSYTNNLLEKGTIVDLCLNRKKIWQQLKLLMHSMPDVNEEVDLDFDILAQQEFKKKFESVIGGIKCRITGPPKEPAVIMNALLGNSPSNKLDTFDDFDNNKIIKQQQQLILSSSINCQNLPNSSIDWTDSPSLFTQQQQQQTNTSIIPTNQGPGTIGMERRQNRNSNGNSYLSGDSGIYSSASDNSVAPEKRTTNGKKEN